MSIRAVAHAAGVTPPSIYLHFSDKSELLFAVCEELYRQLDQFVAAAVADAGDPVEELHRRGRAYVHFGVSHPEAYRILFMTTVEGARDERLMKASGFTALVDNVERAMHQQAIAAGDPLLVATGLWALVHGITSLAISFPGFPRVGLDALVDHQLAVHCAGLGATSAE